ncbi:nitrous oxide reductase family maturation protein NosD [Algoriphagus sp. Y33]|uniref:right-handed parallel beta-helix repeat-containing protein n=1 Tax=Algoriphagus sp. Y33 TaxID=2772483 RepID=UPI001785C159|nr:right-handed parallel beta-helix repeat-containing protein [Algoriphagus sp. Y33]
MLSSVSNSFATDYYFSSSMGSDSFSLAEAQFSATPWKSIEKFNDLAYSLKPGDRVFFKRGDVFHGTIRPIKGGAAENPIIFDAYGSGDLPVITSLVELANAEHVGHGVYQYQTLDSEVSQLKVVLIDDQVRAMGRYPNADDGNDGYLTIQSVNNDFSIGGSELPFNPAGGEVVIRKNNWIIDSYRIKSTNSGIIDFTNRGTSGYKPLSGYGYFIQNHLAALDQFGEWAFSDKNKKLSVYLGEINPSEVKVEVATSDYLLVVGFIGRNLSFRNMHFRGSNKNLINIEKSSTVSIENCLLEFAGENAVFSFGTPNLTLKNNTIRNALSSSIFLWHSSPRAVIADNFIEHTMPFQGMGKNSDLNGIGIYISSDADSSLIEKNRVIHTGYNGIHFGGNGSVVKNNFVKDYCLFKQDGAGIYMNSDGMTRQNNKGRVIIGNVVLDGLGAKGGTDSDADLAEGIYLDDNTRGVLVTQNTVAHINGKGIFLHNASDIEIVDNLVYDCQVQLKIVHDSLGKPVRGIKVGHNFLSSTGEREIIYSISSIKKDIDQIGVSLDNYFLDPYTTEFVFESKDPDHSHSVLRNFSNWKDAFGYDESSTLLNFNLNRVSIIKEVVLKESNFSRDISLVTGTYKGQSKWIDSGLDRGSWSIYPDSQESTLCYVPIGTITEGDKILVVMEVKSTSENLGVELFLERSFDHNQQQAISYFSSSLGRKRVKVFLDALVSEGNESLVLRIPTEVGSLFIDNLKISKVTTKEESDQLFFKYNYSDKSVSFPLKGSYKDGKGRVYSGSVSIAPYRSILLVKEGE